MPEETAKEARRVAKEDGFASMSEFFRHLLREEKQRKLAEELNKQRLHGRWIKAKSMRDLR